MGEKGYQETERSVDTRRGVLAPEVIRWGTEAHERALHAPSLATHLVCGDQETGRSCRETAPEEPTASQNLRVRQCGASKRGNRPPHSIISKYVTKLTKHRILQEALRDRRARSTSFYLTSHYFPTPYCLLRNRYSKEPAHAWEHIMTTL